MEHQITKYKFVSREVKVNEIFKGEMRNLRVIIIGVLDKDSNIIYPHPLTNFIKSMYEYQGKSINSQIIPAQVVCKFLNFIIDKLKAEDVEFLSLIEEGINGLKRLHASRYITTLSLEGKDYRTVSHHEKYLNKFYIYLKEMNIIDEEFEYQLSKGKGNKIPNSIFRHPSLSTRYPSKQTSEVRAAKLKDFGKNSANLTAHFINIARNVAPEISLGLCFQFYGGLRRGEVVNVTRSDLIIHYRESMEVQIKDNRRLLFPRLTNTNFENPKRLNYLDINLAKQTILDNDLVWDVYDEHLKTLDILIKKGKCTVNSALFIDKDGKPMSGKVYERRFKKVKKAFLDSLVEYNDFSILNKTIWNTHIGRGVFTNLLINMGLTVTQLAIARGDRNINSALKYIDETFTNIQIQEAIDEFKKYPIEQLGFIDMNQIRRVWEKGDYISGKKN
ncbi:site-specific integrase [Priestia aryabhattai]